MGEKIDRVKLLSIKWRAEPAELTRQQRQVIEYRLQGLSFAEIAKRMNLAEHAVRELEAELLARVPPSE
jgi:DNA-binding CsgD family transcriptional regulator